MRRIRYLLLISSILSFFFGCLSSQKASAFDAEISLDNALMQQPTSQYYLWAYGAHINIAADNRKFILRGAYIERPRFEASGFADQERMISFFLGSQSTTFWKSFDVLVFGGYGEANGYLKATSKESTLPNRTFKLRGPSFVLELSYNLSKWFRINFGHQVLVGLVNKEEANAYVAWPYIIYQVGFGFVL